MSANGPGPATLRQIEGLRKFGCDPPKGLNFQEADDWLELLFGKKKSGTEITDLDRSGPPSFHEAGPQGPTAPSPHATAPRVPPPAVDPVDPMPSTDAWSGVEFEVTETVAGKTVRESVKFSDHIPPGETYVQAATRLRARAREALLPGKMDVD
jgi:hypothetical protein